MSLRLPRFLARPLALLLGYFWLPCPICGRMMAGFEWDGRCWYAGTDTSTGHGFCSRHPWRQLFEVRSELYPEEAGVRVGLNEWVLASEREPVARLIASLV